MSFDQKKSRTTEQNEWNIKSHLNTSLDMDGISVSEDLINRTLEAIKKQSQETSNPLPQVQEEKPEKKVIPWYHYARNIAAVAAAGLILVLGINGLGQTGRKSDQSVTDGKKADNISYDMAAKEAAPEATASSKEDNGSTIEFAADSSERMDALYITGESSNNMTGEEETNHTALTTKDAGADMKAAGGTLDDDNKAEGDSLLLSFREICPIPPETAESITLLVNASEEEHSISDPDTINQFYYLMEGYGYALGDTTEGTVQMTITIMGAGEICTLELKEGIIVTSYGNGTSVAVNSFKISDDKKLLDELVGWYQTN